MPLKPGDIKVGDVIWTSNQMGTVTWVHLSGDPFEFRDHDNGEVYRRSVADVVRRRPNRVQPGDRVLLPTYSGEVTYVSGDGYTFAVRDDETGEIRWRSVIDVVDHVPVSEEG